MFGWVEELLDVSTDASVNLRSIGRRLSQDTLLVLGLVLVKEYESLVLGWVVLIGIVWRKDWVRWGKLDITANAKG